MFNYFNSVASPETSLLGARNAQGIDFYNMPNTSSWAINFGVKF
jgi:hypothetical protein